MRFTWLPTDDWQQRVRFRRYLIAAGTSLMVVALLGVAFLQGILGPAPFAVCSAATLAAIAAFYVLFRTGLNRRARDPSLTIPMMIAATCVVTYASYHAGAGRGAFLLMYPVIMFFGLFRLNTRALLVVCALILCAYALGLGLLLQRQPSALDTLRVELLQGMVLASVLVWFALMGGYVHELRNRLRQSGFDHLTGAFNRRRILDALAGEKIRCDRGAAPFCIGLADIDGFKGINDKFGHQAGDLALQSFAEIARGELRAIDFTGRYGGDEFLLVLVQTPLAGARECAERVRRETEKRAAERIDDGVQISVSIGIAQYRPDEPLDATLKRADAALYRAKSGGRNRIESDF